MYAAESTWLRGARPYGFTSASTLRKISMSDSATVKRNVAKVREFIDAGGAVDPDWAMACLSNDIVYINQPIEPVVGQTDVRKIVAGIMKLSKAVNWELRNCFGYGTTVVTERLDGWDFDGKGWGLKLPCIGMFDVNDAGLICGWRDYFDNRMWFDNGGPTLHLD
jgi:limonene-1,2-epoxide hydrolase